MQPMLKKEIELLWPIKSGLVYDENQIEQWHD